MSKESDAVARRRKRKSSSKIAKPSSQTPNEGRDKDEDVDIVFQSMPSVKQSSKQPDGLQSDGSNSFEDLFGLGDDQLKDLMDLELPVPREDLVTKTAKEETDDKSKVFQLPELTEFIKKVGTVDDMSKTQREIEENKTRVSRKNIDEYRRLMELNPFADADESLFQEEYDIIPSIFGSGKLLGIPVPYLQTGHGILAMITLLSALVYAPGNPLTEFPSEIRAFLQQGLSVIYSINLVLAIQAAFKAKAKNLPASFWTIKTFILGGIAFYELSQAKDPTINTMTTKYKADNRRRK